MKKIAFVLAALILSSCAISACALLGKGDPAPRLFTLNAPLVRSNGQRVPQSLQILLPEANPGIDADRIALRDTDNAIDYYAGAKWASALPILLQAMFVEGFDHNGQLKSVGSDLVVMKDSYQLLIEVRDFQAEYIKNTINPRAHVRLTAKLLRSSTNSIIRTQIYDEVETTTDNTMAAVVSALDKAYQRAGQRIIGDTVGALAREPAVR